MEKAESRTQYERRLLQEAQSKGTLSKVGVYCRLSGPGWLQSAITLGGGSLANGLYLGIFAGVGLMWVQPLAMAMGVVMLAAIAYVTTTTGERPFRAINEHVNPVLAWSWLLASQAANMVWCLPQYSLATGVLQQNLLPDVVGPDSPLGDNGGKLVIVISVLAVTTIVTWAYNSGARGVKVYETVLKTVVAMIVLCFFGVVFALRQELPWGKIATGFIPDVSRLFRPSDDFAPLLAAVPDTYRQFWNASIVREQQQVLIGATATAVGINMTFLFPYSLLAKKWGKAFRGLVIFDLATGMLIPFMLVTSCVVIAAANQFHPKPGEPDGPAGLKLSAEHASAWVDQRAAYRSEQTGSAAEPEPLSDAERVLAAHLVRRDAFDLARSLAPFTGKRVANLVFGIGVLGMTLSTISILMLISGFCVCEMLGLPAQGWPFRFGCLAAATGMLGPFVWADEARFWLAVPTSVFGMMLLPIAYWSFLLLMNQRSLLGQERPGGTRRLLWNGLMVLSAGAATYLCLHAIMISPLGPGGQYPVGMPIFGGLIVLAAIVHFARRARSGGNGSHR